LQQFKFLEPRFLNRVTSTSFYRTSNLNPYTCTPYITAVSGNCFRKFFL